MDGWWQVLKQRNKMTQTVEFRVAIYNIHMYSQRVNIPLQFLDRHALTVGVILGHHS